MDFCIRCGDKQQSASLPDPSRSLRMYSSELSSKASSSAPNGALQEIWSVSLITEKHVCVQVSRALNQPAAYNTYKCNKMTQSTKQLLTSKLHVGHNDLLTNASECILVFKKMLVVRPFTDWSQELDGIAYKLKQRQGVLFVQGKWAVNTSKHR